MPHEISVARAITFSSDLAQSVAVLLRQLSKTAGVPTDEELAEIVAHPTTALLIARKGSAIVGMLTLAVFRVPSGIRAIIEDVVVDTAARGLGVGEALCRRAITVAGDLGAVTVDLTSRPSREAANRLYERVGFTQRETNVWRIKLI